MKRSINLFHAPLTAGSLKVDFSVHLGFQITNRLIFFLCPKRHLDSFCPLAGDILTVRITILLQCIMFSKNGQGVGGIGICTLLDGIKVFFSPAQNQMAPCITTFFQDIVGYLKLLYTF